MIEGVTVDVTCCRGQRRSRLLRAAEIGDILRRGGGFEERGRSEGLGDDGNRRS